MYIRAFSTPEGRDALVEHLLALDPADTTALVPRLKDIVAPTAILWGEHDPYLSVSIGRDLQQTIPRSTFEILPDVRHFVPEEAPERVARSLADWLQR
jgi:pimeloyl-ACP methyl ester carboxylesterase